MCRLLLKQPQKSLNTPVITKTCQSVASSYTRVFYQSTWIDPLSSIATLKSVPPLILRARAENVVYSDTIGISDQGFM